MKRLAKPAVVPAVMPPLASCTVQPDHQGVAVAGQFGVDAFPDKYVPRVAKLEKHKYAAYVDTHVGAMWDMALQAPLVRICKKRKLAEKAALALVAEARRREPDEHNGA